jgi:hypothetical protein
LIEIHNYSKLNLTLFLLPKFNTLFFLRVFLNFGDNFLQSNSLMKTVIFECLISNWTSSSLFYSCSVIIDIIVRCRNLVSNQNLDFVGFPETRIGLFFFGEANLRKVVLPYNIVNPEDFFIWN